MKDNFSKLSHLYARFRPTYPPQLFEFLISLVAERKTAWDCGTGNGQVAGAMAAYFDRVYATDISENQIKHAVAKPNIVYKLEPAEKTSFSSDLFDLITVAQAVHWFDFPRFYKEVDRTLKPGGILALFAYSLLKTGDETDAVIDNFYTRITDPYWDEERKYVDDNYQTIPFPFREIKAPSFVIEHAWEFDELAGYLNTWSAVQHYIEKNNANPVNRILDDLRKSWGSALKKKVTFPVFMRIGRKLQNGERPQ
jgi:SAM-dependent methyltransferase